MINLIFVFVSLSSYSYASQTQSVKFDECKIGESRRFTWPFRKKHEPPTLESNYIEVKVYKNAGNECHLIVDSYIEQAETPY